jgi:hypothetical protein
MVIEVKVTTALTLKKPNNHALFLVLLFPRVGRGNSGETCFSPRKRHRRGRQPHSVVMVVPLWGGVDYNTSAGAAGTDLCEGGSVRNRFQ